MVADGHRSSRKDSFLAALLERSDTDDPVRIEFLAEVFARQAGAMETGSALDVGDEMRPAMVKTIRRWIDVMLESQAGKPAPIRCRVAGDDPPSRSAIRFRIAADVGP